MPESTELERITRLSNMIAEEMAALASERTAENDRKLADMALKYIPALIALNVDQAHALDVSSTLLQGKK